MSGLLIIFVVLGLGSWGIFTTARRLRRMSAGRWWWFAFVALLIVGIVAGSWLAFRLEYQVSPRMRVASFPLPLAFYRLEGGTWVDYVIPRFVLYPGLVANVVAIIAFTLSPLLFAGAMSRRPDSAAGNPHPGKES
jgi:heme A synthase